MSSSNQGPSSTATYAGEVNLARWRGPIDAVAIERALSTTVSELQDELEREYSYHDGEIRDMLYQIYTEHHSASPQMMSLWNKEGSARVRADYWEAIVLAKISELFNITGRLEIQDVLGCTGIGETTPPSDRTLRAFSQANMPSNTQWRSFARSVDDKIQMRARSVSEATLPAMSEAEAEAAAAVMVALRQTNESLSEVYEELREQGGEQLQDAASVALEALLEEHHAGTAGTWTSDNKAQWKQLTLTQLLETGKILGWKILDNMPDTVTDLGSWDPRRSVERVQGRKAECLLRWSKSVMSTYKHEHSGGRRSASDRGDAPENEGDVMGGEGLLETFDFEAFNAEEGGDLDSWMSG